MRSCAKRTQYVTMRHDATRWLPPVLQWRKSSKVSTTLRRHCISVQYLVIILKSQYITTICQYISYYVALSAHTPSLSVWACIYTYLIYIDITMMSYWYFSRIINHNYLEHSAAWIMIARRNWSSGENHKYRLMGGLHFVCVSMLDCKYAYH